MSKRSGGADRHGQLLLSPGLKEAPVLDLMCSHFVLTLAARQGAKFNVRRDLNSLLSLSGRHLVWPLPALQRLRASPHPALGHRIDLRRRALARDRHLAQGAASLA